VRVKPVKEEARVNPQEKNLKIKNRHTCEKSLREKKNPWVDGGKVRDLEKGNKKGERATQP